MMCPWKETVANPTPPPLKGWILSSGQTHFPPEPLSPPLPCRHPSHWRSEVFPLTTPKLASNVWTYVCWETSQQLKLLVIGASCWLATFSSVLLGVRNRYICPSNLLKCLKWLQKALFMLCCCLRSFSQNVLLGVPEWRRYGRTRHKWCHLLRQWTSVTSFQLLKHVRRKLIRTWPNYSGYHNILCSKVSLLMSRQVGADTGADYCRRQLRRVA